MNLSTFHELLSAAGQSALAAAAALSPTEPGFLQVFEKLRKKYPEGLARAALETVLLRIRAREKHSFAEKLYFTREALEQSSSEAVSRYRADRFRPFGRVLDLCCGAGIDAIHLALAGCVVTAIDSDPLKLAMAKASAAEMGAPISFLEGDVLTMPFLPAEAAFVDPSRRIGDRRLLDPSKYAPPLDAVLARFPLGFPLAAKIAPGVALRDLERYDAEIEFISSAGELKECVLWFGPLKTARRRATVLPGHSLASDTDLEEPHPSPLGESLFDPDAALIRAGLLALLAEQIGAAPVDHGVALLTGNRPADSPFARRYQVEAVLPFQMAQMREYLRQQNVGRVTLLKRAVDADVNAVMKQLKLKGDEHRPMVLTKSMGRRVAIVLAD